MASLNVESRIYRLTGLTPIMGSLPASDTIRTEFLASRAPNAEEAKEEAFEANMDTRGLTIFARNKQGQLCIMGYQVKGFFKSALYALKGQFDIAAYKTRVDLMVFCEPRFIPLLRNGRPIYNEDSILERPLRTTGPKGERMSLAASERIDDPWAAEVEISLIPQGKTSRTKGDILSWEIIEAALEYGAYHGLGQWRNADYGRFLWEHIQD